MADNTRFEVRIPIAKADEDRQMVFGWASVVVEKDGKQVVDQQNDMIDIGDLESAAYDFVLNSRDAGEMHVRKGIGRLVESVVFDAEKIEKMGLPAGSLPQGWWTGFKIDDADAWAGVKSGKYSMFSIGGSAVKVASND